MTDISETYYPGLTESDAKSPLNVTRIVNNMLGGALNVTRNIILPTGATPPLLVEDPRIHPGSFIIATAFGNVPPVVDILSVGSGECQLSWTDTLIADWD